MDIKWTDEWDMSCTHNKHTLYTHNIPNTNRANKLCATTRI